MLAILVGKLQRHRIFAEEEPLLCEERFGRIFVCVVFDESEALDGAKVLAWRGIFRNADALNCAVRTEAMAQLDLSNGAWQVPRDQRTDLARVDVVHFDGRL